MDFKQPVGGTVTGSGIWVPNTSYGEKLDRSQTGLTPKPRSTYAGILQEGGHAENRFRDLSSYINAVKSVPWVWACVSVIAYNFANNGYQYLNADRDEVTDPYDPFLRLWEKPNPRQTGFHFRELFMHYMLLAGEAFISLEEWTANDEPTEMYLPNPARMRVVQSDRTGEIIGYEYDAGSSQLGGAWKGVVPYEPFEIIHVKYANPLDELRGLGAIEAMESTLNIVAEMTGTELSYWKSGGRITGVLQTEQQVDDLSFEKLVQRWREFTATGRDRNRFKTAILEQGLKYQPIAEGLRGIDMVKLENSKRDEVTAALGVPLQKLGIFSADTGYKADDADRFFYGETMEPIFTRVEDGGVQPLVDVFNPDNLFRFARRNYEDDTVKLNNAKIMQTLGFTFGEIADYLGIDPPDDIRREMIFPMPGAAPLTLDQLNDLSKGGLQHPLEPPPQPVIHPPVAAPGPRAVGQIPLAGTQPSATNTENGRSNRVDTQGHLPNTPQSVVKFLTAGERESLKAQYEIELARATAVKRAIRRPSEAKGLAKINVIKAARLALKIPAPRRAALLPGTGEMMRRATGSIRSRLASRFKVKIQAALDQQRRALTPILKDAIPAFRGLETTEQRRAWLRERWDARPLDSAIRALHVEAANDGWRLGKRSLGFGKSAAWETKQDEGEGDMPAQDFVNEALSGRYDRLVGRRITEMDETTIADVEEIVSEGVRRGYSPLQIANGVEAEDFPGVTSVFQGAPTWETDPEAMPGFEYRAEMIARTEAMFAANWGATTSLMDSGISQVEAMDGDGDPECAERDGQVFDLDADTGRAVDDNGDPVEDHPNGTLAWSPVIDINPVETGALDDTGPVTSFEGEEGVDWEWKETRDADGAVWQWAEQKWGTGQTNNPEGHNQYGPPWGSGGGSGGGGGGGGGGSAQEGAGHGGGGGHVGAHPGGRRRGGRGGGGGGGGGGARGTTGRGRGRGRGHGGRHGGHGVRHTHANGVGHTHQGGAINHSHQGATTHAHQGGTTRPAGSQQSWDEYVATFAGRNAEWETKYNPDQERDDRGRFGEGGGEKPYIPEPRNAGQLRDHLTKDHGRNYESNQSGSRYQYQQDRRRHEIEHGEARPSPFDEAQDVANHSHLRPRREAQQAGVKGDAPGHEFHGNQYTNGGLSPVTEHGIVGGTRWVHDETGKIQHEAWIQRQDGEHYVANSYGETERARQMLNDALAHEALHKDITDRESLVRHLESEHPRPGHNMGDPLDEHRFLHGPGATIRPPSTATGHPAGEHEAAGIASIAVKTVDGWEIREVALKYSGDQPRDDHGRWSDAGGSGAGLITSIDEAIQRLGEGKGVMFDRPERAVTLLTKLASMAKDAKARGEKPKVYDLCKVSVEGTNLFCAENMGIPRSQMPQLKGVPTPGSPADSLPKDAKGEVDLGPAFKDFLGAQGHSIAETEELASHLRASQKEMDGSKVGGMMVAMEEGKIPPAPIFISKENYVIDGHHRWAATVGLDWENSKADLKMPVSRIDMPILTALQAANGFADRMGIPQAAVGASNPANKAFTAQELRSAVVAVAAYAVDVRTVGIGAFGEPILASDLRLGPDQP